MWKTLTRRRSKKTKPFSQNAWRKKRYDQAIFYKINGKYRAAEVYFELIIERYPKSKLVAKAKHELEDMKRRSNANQGVIDETLNRVFK